MIVTEGDHRTNQDRPVEIWISTDEELDIRTSLHRVLYSKEEKDSILKGLVPHLEFLMDARFIKELQEVGYPATGPGCRSLVEGVRDLQREWPVLLPAGPRLEELIGFLFATLPLAEKELKGEG